MIDLKENWEFNVLEIYNYRSPGAYEFYFDFINNNSSKLEGDILEAGVYRGKTLLAAGLLLKELNSSKKVFGYDTFTGFPPVYNKNDDISNFTVLYETGRISKEHFESVKRNQMWREQILETPLNASNISSSGNFGATSIDFIRKRLELLDLGNVELIQGQFNETMKQDSKLPGKIMAVLMDCDLYSSYQTTLEFVWPRLVVGGIIFLDEYYSLKFPGARIATDDFIHDKNVRLVQLPRKKMEFERWYLEKLG